MEESSATAPVGLGADSRIAGSFRPPGSKSIAQRALLCAAGASGRTRLRGLSPCSDVLACMGLIEAGGAPVHGAAPDDVEVEGRPAPAAVEEDDAPRGLRTPGDLEAGESATLARFATATFALGGYRGGPVAVSVSGSLRRRTSAPLFAALREAGVSVEGQERPDGWPVEVRAIPCPGRLEITDPVSSQEVSALWIAAAVRAEPVVVTVRGHVPSRPYLGLTHDVLRGFGVEVETSARADGGFDARVAGPLRAPGAPLLVEPDASSAAVALGAACLAGGHLTIEGIPASSAQGDVRIVEHLRALGCEAEHDPEGLSASGFPARGARLDLEGEPDLAPVLAVLAAGAALRSRVSTHLTGLSALHGKESDRLEGLVHGLVLAGWRASANDGALLVEPPREAFSDEPILLDPRGDHRMAMAFALLGLLRPNVFVAEPDCVAKSWPRFWQDLEGLGAHLAPWPQG